MSKSNEKVIAIIGLGYVGLPLAIEFGKIRKTIGFDINNDKVNLLKKQVDETKQITKKDFIQANNLSFTNTVDDIKFCEIYIIAVPTPVTKNNTPNLNFLQKANELVGSVLKKDNIVILESTVYPGTTEEFCVPILEKYSGLKFNKSFFCGYSPERINPGDQEHTLTKIVKVVSGSNKKTTLLINKLYSQIIVAGTYIAQSIKVAEAAKIIENSQRDINIAFVNELSLIFSKLKLDTQEVLNAANTKWNFLNFRPGLVGGHCIGVDPYYLAYKAKQIGIDPQVILSGRDVNNNMSKFICDQIFNDLKSKKNLGEKVKILLLGLTFKEDCLDLRNSKSKDIFNILKGQGFEVQIHDPYADVDKIKKEYLTDAIKVLNNEQLYDVVVIAVSHKYYKKLKLKDFVEILSKDGFIYDLKGILPKNKFTRRL